MHMTEKGFCSEKKCIFLRKDCRIFTFFLNIRRSIDFQLKCAKIYIDILKRRRKNAW